MADLPSFFNRADFIGKYLAGYILVISYILLFKFDFLVGDPKKIDVNLFSSLVFIVAGPAFGYAITNFHRTLPYIKRMIIGPKNDNARQKAKNKLLRYAKLRTVLSEEEKVELDMSEAEYDFCVSAGIVFVILAILTLYEITFGSLQLSEFYIVFLVIFALCLFVNAFFQLKKSYGPLISAFMSKHKIR